MIPSMIGIIFNLNQMIKKFHGISIMIGIVLIGLTVKGYLLEKIISKSLFLIQLKNMSTDFLKWISDWKIEGLWETAKFMMGISTQNYLINSF